MSLIEKQLVKFGFTEVTNFQQLVNLGFPMLFKFEENNQVYIGFTNQYKPGKGILQFAISPTNKKDIELYLQNQKTPNTLFNESKTTQYYLENHKRTATIINSNDLKNALPSEYLTYDNPFNMIYIYD